MTAALALVILLAGEAPESPDAAQFPDYVRIRPGVAVAGQPTAEGLARLKALGFRSVVDLRREDEAGRAEEKAAVEAAGLRYLHVPVSAGTLSRNDVNAVARVLDDSEAGPVLLHCATGNRAGGLWALAEAARGVPLEEAIADGRKAGLKSESMVEAVRRVAAEAASSPASSPTP